MEVVVEGRIKGMFHGWGKGKVFVLSKGFHKRWEQIEDRDQFSSTYQPKAKLWRDGAKHYLEVEGMSEMVEVQRAQK